MLKFLSGWLMWQISMIHIPRVSLFDSYQKEREHDKNFARVKVWLVAFCLYGLVLFVALVFSGQRSLPGFWLLSFLIVPTVIVSFFEYVLHIRDSN